jgi:hypothetical protein
MSDKIQSEGHWESHSYASQTTKVGDNPSTTVGKEASAEGTFDVRPILLHFFIFLMMIIDCSMVNQY